VIVGFTIRPRSHSTSTGRRATEVRRRVWIAVGADLTVDTVTNRTRSLLRALPLTAVALILVACGGASSSSTFTLPKDAKWEKQSGSDVAVEARDNVFVPQFIEVKKGTTVTFENTGRNRHNVLPDTEGDFEDIPVDKLDPGMKDSRTFDDVGEFGYYCSLHGTATKGMFGAIKVTE